MNIPKTMKAAILTGHGGLDKISYQEDWPTPTPTENEALIKVAACGLNNTDVNTRTGWYSKDVTQATTGEAYQKIDENDPTRGGEPLTFPRVQGADVAGTVVAVGKNANTDLLGQRVITDNWLRNWHDPLNKNTTGYFGSECNGGYAQYTIDYRNVAAINSTLSNEALATFSC